MIDAFFQNMTATGHYNVRKSAFKSAIKSLLRSTKIFRPSTLTDIFKMDDYFSKKV